MMYFANEAMKNAFVGASAAASFAMPESTSEKLIGVDTACLAVSIFILCLRLWTLSVLPVRIMMVGILLTVLVVWNQAERRTEEQGSKLLRFPG